MMMAMAINPTPLTHTIKMSTLRGTMINIRIMGMEVSRTLPTVRASMEMADTMMKRMFSPARNAQR